MNIRKSLAVLSCMTFLATASCKQIQIKNTTACSVSGVIAAGADCIGTISGVQTQMNLDQLIEFLEPQEAVKDSKGNVIRPERAGAIIQSAEDFNYTKTALESACIQLGNLCTYEIKHALQKANQHMKTLTGKVKHK